MEIMRYLDDLFSPRFDDSHTQDEQLHLECFCAIAAGIEVRLSPLSCSLRVVSFTVALYKE